MGAAELTSIICGALCCLAGVVVVIAAIVLLMRTKKEAAPATTEAPAPAVEREDDLPRTEMIRPTPAAPARSGRPYPDASPDEPTLQARPGSGQLPPSGMALSPNPPVNRSAGQTIIPDEDWIGNDDDDATVLMAPDPKKKK